MSESVYTIPAGHEGLGRDGRRGNRKARSGSKDDLSPISAGAVYPPWWCCHQAPLGEHECIEQENRLRAERGCPPL